MMHKRIAEEVAGGGKLKRRIEAIKKRIFEYLRCDPFPVPNLLVNFIFLVILVYSPNSSNINHGKPMLSD